MVPNTIHSSLKEGVNPKSRKSGDSAREKENKLPFRSLSPTNDADQTGNYCKALLWALDNREASDIKNIALTGPYGSGKSSILKTFVSQVEEKREDLHFLHISLATFKEQQDTPHPKPQHGNRTTEAKQQVEEELQLLRQIEYSILQQIFYHVSHKDIPHTRFRKQRSLTKEQSRNWTFGIFIFLLSLIFEFYNQQLWSVLEITPYPKYQLCFHLIAWLVLAFCTYNFIKQSVNSLHTIKLRKFNIKSAEFGVDNSLEKSILNEHLDEILYFFDVTRYNVVIIEDLDRFNQPEIYTKLREINQLINNKADRKGVVSFIYAVKDDMFLDRNRTKFFDFIIPVIPVVGPTNSNEILRRLINENQYDIDTDLVDGIAAYVDDMRLLYNIMNEFYIYRQSLNENLKPNNLLALILYKNAYPKDFVALSNREGTLYSAIEQKDRMLQEEVGLIDEQLRELKERKAEAHQSSIKNLTDLKKIYVLEALSTNDGIVEFDYNGTRIGIRDMVEEYNFQLLLQDKLKAVVHVPDSGSYENYRLSFGELENAVDPEESYSKKIETLKYHQKFTIEEIDEKVKQLESDKWSLRAKSIQELMQGDLMDLTFTDRKQQQLVSILLRSGYIDEYFESYISIFYPESISRSDADFILNVQAKIKTDFNYPLNHVSAVISKLKEIEFEREFILNHQVVDHLLLKKSSAILRDKLFTLLANESGPSLQFINAYLKRGKKIDQFTAALVNKWENIWNYFQKAEKTHDYDFPYDIRELIITNGNVSDLLKIARISNLKSYIESRPDFLAVPMKGKKMEALVSDLGLKFGDIDMEVSPDELLDYIFNGNYYELNEIMIRKWYMHYDGSEASSLVNRNYSVLKNSLKVEPLVDYISTNFTTYIEQVWLTLDGNQQEDPEYFEDFLLSEVLSKQLKFAIIAKCEAKVPDVSKFKDLDFVRMLLRAGKVTPNWLNLLRYYLNNGQFFDNFIISFLNVQDNAFELEIETLDGKSEIAHDVVHDFGEALILCNDIEDTIYSDLLESIPWKYNSDFNFSTLTHQKAYIFIKKLETTPENYEMMKNSHRDLVVDLLVADIDRFLKNIDQYDLDAMDIRYLLREDSITVEQKNDIIKATYEQLIIGDFLLLEEIAAQNVINKDLFIPQQVMMAIVRNRDIQLDQRIKISYKLFEHISAGEIKDILGQWEDPYNQLSILDAQFTFKHAFVDHQFLKLLLSHAVLKDLKTSRSGISVHTT